MNYQSEQYSKNNNSKYGSGQDDIYKIFDFLFPGSNSAKLVKVFDAYRKNFPYKEIIQRLGLVGGSPVLNLIAGRNGTDRNKLYAGIARACFNTDAIIIDNGISTGIEKHSMRKGLKLIGVAPENEVQNPKVNSTYQDPNELSQGHTHLFLLNNQELDLQWTQEALFKITLALRLAEGDFQKSGLYQRVVHILVGDGPNYIDEVRLAVKFQQPIVVIPGSDICNKIIQGVQSQNGQFHDVDEELIEYLTKYPQYFFMLLDEGSDEVAQYVHFFLTVTPYKQSTPILYLSKDVPQNSQQESEEEQENNYDQEEDQRQYDDDNFAHNQSQPQSKSQFAQQYQQEQQHQQQLSQSQFEQNQSQMDQQSLQQSQQIPQQEEQYNQQSQLSEQQQQLQQQQGQQQQYQQVQQQQQQQVYQQQPQQQVQNTNKK